MKSFTGKFTSVRGWALLLALLLGAGMMISACGDEEVPAPTTPAPPPAPPAPEPEPEPEGPATPGNLRVSATTSSSLTWTWDAVEGALGYEGQFSTDATFTDADQRFGPIRAPQTSYTVKNLSGNMTGHFRVRSGTGTSLTELTYSEWTDGVSGSTAAPPPAARLDAPDNVRSTDRSDDSITLEWDEVDDADTYEVEQRETGDDWSDASCGTADGDNVVDEEECVASGLDEGTDYDFRVRAVPDDDDEAHTVGVWSDIAETRTAGDAPATPTAPIGGGMGNLNVRWESTATSITWIWDRVAGKKYDIYAAVTTYTDSANPCEDVSYNPMDSSATSHPLTVTAGQVALACVRTDNPDNPSENLSFAWAAATPEAPSLGDPAATRARDTDKDNVDDMTTALLWEDFDVKGGFNYEYRVAADPHGDSQINGGTTDADDVQAACTAGAALDDGESDVDYTDDNIVLDGGLKTFTGYLLCARYSNSAGTSGWAVPADNAEAYTRPARPSSPTVYTSLVDEMPTTTAVVWRVATRGRDGLPRVDDGYTVRTIQHLERKANSDNDGTVAIKTPTAATCGVTSPDDDYTRTNVTDGDIDNDADGIVISPSTAFARPAAYSTDTDSPTPPQDRTGNRRVYVCVQAMDAATGTGPWVLSSAYTVKQQAASN